MAELFEAIGDLVTDHWVKFVYRSWLCIGRLDCGQMESTPSMAASRVFQSDQLLSEQHSE